MPRFKTAQKTIVYDVALTSATSTQLAKINQLEQKIKELARQTNRLYSSLLTIFIFYYGTKKLVLEEAAPLHSYYQELQKQYLENVMHDWKTTEIDPFVDRTFAMTDGLSKLYESLILDSTSKLFSLMKIPNVGTLEEKIERLDALLDSEIKQSVTTDLIAVYNRIVSEFNSHFKIFSLLEEADYKTVGIKTMHSKITGLISQFNQQVMPGLIKQGGANKAKETAQLAKVEVHKWIVSSKIALALISQVTLVEPVVNYLFPQGVFNKRQSHSPNILTMEEAETRIEFLTEQEEELNKRVKVETKIAKWSMPFVFAYAMYLMFESETPNAESILFAILLIAVTARQVQQDAWNYYERRELGKNLSKQEKLWEAALAGDGKVNCEMANSMGTSYFSLNFTSIQSKSKEIEKEDATFSAKKAASLFKDCCIYHGIEITSQRDQEVTLPALSGINATKMQLIKTMFQTSIERHFDIRKLRAQVDKINQCLSTRPENFRFKIMRDEAHLPVAHFHFIIPREQQKLLEELLSVKAYKVNVQVEGNNSIISFVGSIPLDAESLLKVLKTVNHDSKQSSYSSLKVQLEGEAIKRNPRHASPDHQDEQDITTKASKAEKEPRIVKFANGSVYNSKTSGDIHPVILTKEHSEKAFEEATIFIKNSLDESKLPAGVYEAINEQLKKGRFSPSVGHQGLVFWNTEEKNQSTGEWFDSAAKIKLLGKDGKGKIRAFCKEVKSDTGETLLEVLGVSLKHK